MKLLLYLCVSLALAAPSPEPLQDRAPKCLKCKSVGSLPCGEHKKTDCLLETNVLFCSVMHGCETCGGTGWIDCIKCERPTTEEALADRRAAIPELQAALASQDEEMGRALRKAESEHFVLVWEVEGMKVGRARMGAHQLLHTYVDRLEALYDAYVEAFGLADDSEEFDKKTVVYVWGLLEDHRDAGLKFCEYQADNGVYLRGGDSVYSVCGAKKFFKGDEQLHRNLVHHVSHGLLSHQRPSQWMGNIRAGWADAGVAHWFEDHFFGVCDNYCYQEVNLQKAFKKGGWRPVVRAMVKEESAPPFAVLVKLNTDNLTADQHALSFAAVDYLMTLGKEDFSLLMKRLRSKFPTGDAIKEIYGLKLLEFERNFHAWVLENYPSR